jgi:hypothetical protein
MPQEPGQSAFAAVLHEAYSEQDDIRGQILGDSLVEARETTGFAAIFQDKAKRRANDFVALDHENTKSFCRMRWFETRAHGALADLTRLSKQTPYRDR